MSLKHYDECYFVNYDSYDDLSLYEVGCQNCPPKYSFGPIIRDNYVLHYILNGNGTLYLDNREYSVSAGQAFITPPNLVTFYEADQITPWNYIWIHFNGSKAMPLLREAGISIENPVYIPNSDSAKLKQCMQDILHHNAEEYECIGDLYRIFQAMINDASNRPKPSETDQSLSYIRDVISFIQKKYSEPIKIQDIADFCGLDRSYLSKLFKHATNYTPQEYLIYFRIHKAKHLLKDTDLPIQHIAYAIGYRDPFAFSKIFKKETGISPSDYRQKHLTSSK